MAQECSFDIVCKVDLQELKNSVQHTQKELSTRFDFKGSKAHLELEKNGDVHLVADDTFKLDQLREMFIGKLAKRGISPHAAKFTEPKAAGHLTVAQNASFQNGLDAERVKKITKLIKDLKLKVQAAIQGDQVRVTGKNKDDLQDCIAAIRASNFDFDYQFTNYR